MSRYRYSVLFSVKPHQRVRLVQTADGTAGCAAVAEPNCGRTNAPWDSTRTHSSEDSEPPALAYRKISMNARVCFQLMGLSALLFVGGCSDGTTGPAQTETPSGETGAPTGNEEAAGIVEAIASTDESVGTQSGASPTESAGASVDSGVVTFVPGPDAQKQVLEELILAEEGAVFQFEEGVFEFTDGLSLTVNNVKIRGRGMDRTILSFKNQAAGAEGLYITGDHVVVEDIAIEDTKGNAIKSSKADNIILRRVRTEWTGGPKSTNGAYGFYPVSSRNVLVDDCVAIGASDAGIYVGQSIDVIVKNCRVEYNVAGIEIENCYQAEVFDCVATNNTAGVLVCDLPDLPQQRGHDVRVYNNRIYGNNTANFAPVGNIVGGVPAGLGVEIMANTNVEVFDNEIKDHGTTNVLIVSYMAAGIDIKDPNYYPYPEGVHIHGNQFGACGDKPDSEIMVAIAGTPLPDIVWDGAVNEEKVTDGELAKEASIAIHDNSKVDGELTFVNLGGLAALQDPSGASPARDLAPHKHSLPSVKPVTIAGAE
jgi:parallel beta-helix repeat protein